MKNKTYSYQNPLNTVKVGAFALAFATAPLFAADRVWTGNGTDDNWSTASNWDGGIAPVPGDLDSVTFSGTNRQSNNDDLAFGYYSGITFLNGGFTINGPSNPGLAGDITSTGNNSINTAIIVAGGPVRVINSVSGTLTLPAMVFQGATVQDNSSGTTVFAGTISGGGNLRIFSTGLTVLGGNNSGYDGIIDVYRFAQLSNANGLGGPSTTLRLDRSYNDAFVDLNGLAVTGVNATFTSQETDGGSRLARLRNTNTSIAASFAGDITTTASNNVGVDGAGNMTLSGVISGSNGLTKLGIGTATLSGASANTYAGLTTVSEGTLQLNKSSGNAIAGAIEVSSAGTLLLSSSNNIADGSSVTLSGGTLQRGSGVSEVMGSLSLTDESTISFGIGTTGTLTFGTYSPTQKLNVTSFLEGNVLQFVGTDLTSTINNTSLFAFDNVFSSNWDGGSSTFTITAIPEPSTALALGLAALMLWPTIRHLRRGGRAS